MSVALKGRSLLTWLDYSAEEIRYLLGLAHQLKAESTSGALFQRFAGKTIALLFEKRSTRTRCSFETAFGEEGGHQSRIQSSDFPPGPHNFLDKRIVVIERGYGKCVGFY